MVSRARRLRASAIRTRSGSAPSSAYAAPRRIQLQRSGVLVAQSAASQPDSSRTGPPRTGASSCCQTSPALAERGQGRRRDRLRRTGRRPAPARPSPRAPRCSWPSASEPARRSRRARGRDVADGEHDLDVRGQQLRPLAGSAVSTDGPADRGRGGVELSLGQPQQGKARLWLPAAPAGLSVRLLGSDRSRRAADGSRPAGTRPRRPPRRSRPRTALLGSPCLLQCLAPRSVQLHQLGTMGQAAAGERHQVRLALAPARQGGRPLLRASNLVGVLAGEDHAAVDDPGDDRGELAGRDRHHRLVQQPQPLR